MKKKLIGFALLTFLVGCTSNAKEEKKSVKDNEQPKEEKIEAKSNGVSIIVEE
ncbi:MAG: hypothetical protein ACK5LC_16915 [Coprobacillaceae bacterium]